MTENYDPNKRREDAPFNFAIATLMRIDQILKDIKNISVNIALSSNQQGEYVNQAELLSVKITLLRELYLNASPLLESTQRDTIKSELKNLKITFVNYNVGDHLRPQIITIPRYDVEVEYKIEEIIEQIESEMQKKGAYFMPRKDDPRYASRRE